MNINIIITYINININKAMKKEEENKRRLTFS